MTQTTNPETVMTQISRALTPAAARFTCRCSHCFEKFQKGTKGFKDGNGYSWVCADCAPTYDETEAATKARIAREEALESNGSVQFFSDGSFEDGGESEHRGDWNDNLLATDYLD